MAESTDTRKERRATARAEAARAAEAARSKQRQRLWVLGGALLLVAAVVAVIAIASGGDDTPERRAGESVPGQIDTNARYAGIPQRGIVLGDPRAPLTLVEFADLQCPFCAQYSTGTLPALVDKYVRDGQLRMEFRNLAFIGTDSVRGAQMAGAASLQNKLWQYVDLFYVNQGPENGGYVTDEFLTRIGGAVRGLDVERAMNDRGTASVQRQLNEAQIEWQSGGFTGTPSFLLGPTGGRMEAVLNEQESPTVGLMSERIDAALARLR